MSSPLDMPAPYRLVYYYTGYLLSPHALVVLATGLVLNRAVVMAAVRKPPAGSAPPGGGSPPAHRLPLWSRACVHGGALALLGRTLWGLHTDPNAAIALPCLTALAAAAVAEAFLASTAGTAPLWDVDTPLFELSVQCFLCSLHAPQLAQEQLRRDCALALGSAATVHALELLGARNWRLAVSSVLLAAHAHASRGALPAALASAAAAAAAAALFPAFLRWWFRALPAAIVGGAVWANALRWAVGDRARAKRFFRWLWAEVRECAADDALDALLTVARVCLRGPSQEVQEEETPSPEPRFAGLSGYLHKLPTSPEDTASSATATATAATGSRAVAVNVPYLLVKLRITAELVHMLCVAAGASATALARSVHARLRHRTASHPTPPPRPHAPRRDLNRLVTSYNYPKFLARYPERAEGEASPSPGLGPGPSRFDATRFLLPEFDSSPDYAPPGPGPADYNLRKKAADLPAWQPAPQQEMRAELAALFLDFNDSMVRSVDSLNWHNSMYSMLRHGLENEQEQEGCVTRARYGRDNAETIVDEVALERWTMGEEAPVECSEEDSDEYSDNENMECLLCLQQSRNVVFWPCRCLALCDECRQALGARGLQTCVACGETVQAYTKVNIV
ncbi:hypothetical protein DAKH74_002690 [Maudiozyma humilis]|uniref:RING-type domain-containing protein n=1 Tax=Maudiozyma humilis TaxID=51915 RepID=A0AAV5RSI5_MAUHU|nr:hypothetical protein DAKH74_002690 [Kazachstania humilis]